MKILVLDHGSNYLDSLIEFLDEREATIEIKKPMEKLSYFDCAIASGGRLSRDKYREILKWYRKFLYNLEKPFLGICLGHKILGYCYGAKIKKACERGFSTIRFFKNYPLAPKTVETKVYQDHEYGLFDLPKKLVNYAYSDICKIQVLRVVGKQQYSVQFHPEIEGKDILENFIRLCGNSMI